jgi:hypothetical protein
MHTADGVIDSDGHWMMDLVGLKVRTAVGGNFGTMMGKGRDEGPFLSILWNRSSDYYLIKTLPWPRMELF